MNPDLIKSSDPWITDKDKDVLQAILNDEDTWNIIAEHLGQQEGPEEPEMDVAVCIDDTGLDFLVQGGMYVFDHSADADFIKIEVAGEWREVFIDRFRFQSI